MPAPMPRTLLTTATVALALLAAAAVPPAAQGSEGTRAEAAPEEAESPRYGLLFEPFSVVFARYFPSIDTELRVDSKEFGEGVKIDLEDDLDFDNRDSVTRLEGAVLLGRRHQVGGSYLSINRDSSTVLVEEIRFGDEVFPVDTEVTAFFDVDALGVVYTYWAVRKPKTAFGVSFGLQLLSARTGVRDEQFELSAEVETEAPVPQIGLELRRALAPKLLLRTQGQILDLTISGISGTVGEATAAVEYYPVRQLGLGVGFDAGLLRVKVSEDQFIGRLDYEYWGGRLFLRVRY